MASKYTVFVSSTYTDLVDERDQVIKAVLEMGHIPVGMEMFSAADEQQWKIITNQIDQCDYYIVLVAHKYGSMDGDVSYTEKEYDYAIANGVPTLGFVLDDGASWPQDRVETDDNKRAALARFKEKVKSKPVGFWSSGDELHGKCSIALMKAMNTNPRPGWIRATDAVGPDVLREISRLSAENALLRAQISELERVQAEGDEGQLKEIIMLMEATPWQVSYWPSGASEWKPTLPTTLLRLFKVVVKEASDEAGLQAIANSIAFELSNEQRLRRDWPVPSNVLKALLLDLQSLGLVEPSVRKRSVKDTEQYWTTTELGNRVYGYLRKAQLIRKARDRQSGLTE